MEVENQFCNKIIKTKVDIMVTKTLEIHSENILPIIKRWLYSDKDIFIRELVSNACDAIHKVKILQDKGELTASSDEPFRISLHIDKEKRTLSFVDNGIGMDAEEVQKYIAQIAFSSAEEFMEKYKSHNETDQFIGHFGLGFYSAYMVASKVEINTLSYKEGAEAVRWICDGSAQYELEVGTRTKRGTEIILHVDKDSEEFLEPARIRQILNHYCSFLPYPVYLEDSHINHEEPLWIKSPSECTAEDYLKFYRHLYPMDPDPLFWVHLNVDYPFHLKGILYFPKLNRDFDISKNTVKLFCNRVFVSDNCKDVIPNYLMALRGVIDSPDIPLNVSRSYLQMDRTVRQLANHISKKVADSLAALYRNERERFLECWADVGQVVKLGILEDEKFYEKAKSFLVWKNVSGEWTTVEEYLERNQAKIKDKVFYTKEDDHLSPFAEVYHKQGIEILAASSPFDPYLIQFLEGKLSPVIFKRIDSDIDESILDKEKEKTLLDADGRTEAGKLADFIRSKLDNEQVEVEAKSLAAESVPGVVVIDEQQRRIRDYMRNLDPKDASRVKGFMDKRKLVVNTNSPFVSLVQKLDQIQPELTGDLVKQIYEMALLSQKEMDPAELKEFLGRNTRLLEKLAEKLINTKQP
ncbi:molecular chaperone HtpG [Parachlamydia sp. AcF125]|uniref:molecular chaperone HtpG n=1 Tax=Parachlamydia sp. AcF125 TaxID=2795736 RepID=UPI001BD82048|nr:molecular chaperone HtpG [Parachlamydia sp. AcF125]MBS4167584.1 Chaperone protein HtpG [Parachlamydia sp. AcF125]